MVLSFTLLQTDLVHALVRSRVGYLFDTRDGGNALTPGVRAVQ